METKARYSLIGAFTLLVIAAGFAFVYWLEGSGGFQQRAVYRIEFRGSVAGLNVGAGVLFNGVRVGEVMELRLDPAQPKRVEVTIAIAKATPVRADTRAGIDYQGIAGVPTISLTGGAAASAALEINADTPPLLIAADDASASLTQSARETLKRLDVILADNAEPLKDTIANIDSFSKALARNADRVDDVVAGLERMTGGAAGKPTAVIYDLATPKTFPRLPHPPRGQIIVADPAVLFEFDSVKISAAPEDGKTPDFGNAQWGDTLPKLFQAKIIQSFENAGYLQHVARPGDGLTADFILLTEIRSFRITATPDRQAVVEFTAKLSTSDGRILAARVFRATRATPVLDAPSATAALGEAFKEVVTDLIVWASGATGKAS